MMRFMFSGLKVYSVDVEEVKFGNFVFAILTTVFRCTASYLKAITDGYVSIKIYLYFWWQFVVQEMPLLPQNWPKHFPR